MNQQMSLHGKQAKKDEQISIQAYNLACAKTRLHKGKVHPEEGHKVSRADEDIIIRNGRTRP
jgi:hypothetical protein